MKNDLVSILMPCKNTSSFLDECIKSIINQSYTNWELLVIDDSSEDNSYEIIKSYAARDSRIKAYKNLGEGIIDALQYAFKESSGELITRMDSDDIMRPNKLEVMVNNLKKYGTNHVAVGLVKYFSKEGISEGYKSYEAWLNKLTKSGANYTEIYKECVIPSPCWMTYREDLIACEAFNPHNYPEDYDLTFRFYKHNFKCIPCSKVLHDWRDYKTRTSRTHEHYAQNHFIDLKIKYFLELDYDKNKTLVVWGAGFKGKKIAKTLLDRNIAFEWICDNPKKIGKAIYGKPLEAFERLKELKNSQSIITVANKEAQKEIRTFLNKLKLKAVDDYVFFC